MGVTSLGRHTRPACHPGSIRDVFIKKVDVDLYRVCFSWLWGCEGSGTTFRGLRMRSRSMRKWAHRNAGDLGSRLAVCACAYDPIHVTAQGKRLDPICACVQLSGSILIKTMWRMWIQLLCACVLYSYGSRGLKQWVVTSISHMGEMRDSDWSRPNLLRSDWLPIIGAIMTTDNVLFIRLLTVICKMT